MCAINIPKSHPNEDEIDWSRAAPHEPPNIFGNITSYLFLVCAELKVQGSSA